MTGTEIAASPTIVRESPTIAGVVLGTAGYLSPEQARHLTIHGVARNEDGSYSWKFDNYTRVFFPQRYDVDGMREQFGRITCPTLLVRGMQSWAGDPEEDGRLAAFPDARSVGIDDAEHWVHHDQLDEFLRVVREFLGEGT